MEGLNPMVKSTIKMAAKKLKEYVEKNDGEIELSFNQINDWLKENNHPFKLELVKFKDHHAFKIKSI